MTSAFELKELVGSGSFASVYRAVHRETGKEYAVKLLSLRDGASHYEQLCVLNELRLLATHACCHLVQFKTAFVDEAAVAKPSAAPVRRGPHLHIVTEYARRGDLAAMLKQRHPTPLSEPEVWQLFLPIVCGLDYLHQLGVMHRDIKPANIFLDADNHVKLGDLGVVRVMQRHHLLQFGQTHIGTPLYMAPEIWRHERYTTAVDVWALGCVLHELMARRPAFDAPNLLALRAKICSGPRHLVSKRSPHYGQYSLALRSLVERLLHGQARVRPTAREILESPHVSARMRERGIARLTCAADVKTLFHAPCPVPRRLADWHKIVGMFCEVSHTIELTPDDRARMGAIGRLRSQLERRHHEPPRHHAPEPPRPPTAAFHPVPPAAPPAGADRPDLVHARMRWLREKLRETRDILTAYTRELQALMEHRSVR